MTFLLSTNTVVISTAALVKGLHADYDPMSESGYMLLKRSFEYEFVVTRWSYLVSLLAFLVAVTNRILFEFRLFTSSEVRKTMGVAVCLLMSGLILHIVSFLNSTLYCWNDLGEMTIALIKVRVHTELVWYYCHWIGIDTNRLTLLAHFALLAAVDFIGDVLEKTSSRGDIHIIGLCRSDCCRTWLYAGFDMAQVS